MSEVNNDGEVGAEGVAGGGEDREGEEAQWKGVPGTLRLCCCRGCCCCKIWNCCCCWCCRCWCLKSTVFPKVSLKAALIRSVSDRSSTILRELVLVNSSLSANSFSRSTLGMRPNLTANSKTIKQNRLVLSNYWAHKLFYSTIFIYIYKCFYFHIKSFITVSKCNSVKYKYEQLNITNVHSSLMLCMPKHSSSSGQNQ